MRRMREIPWQAWLLSVPALGVALGVQYWVRHRLPSTPAPAPETAAVLKPSFFWPDSAVGTEYAERGLAAAVSMKNTGGWKPVAPGYVSPGNGMPVYERSDEPEDELFPDDEEVAAGEGAETGIRAKDKNRYQPKTLALNPKKPKPPGGLGGEGDRNPAADSSAAGPAAVLVGQKCMKIEYRGDGPKYTRVTQEEWTRAVTLFNAVKGDLLAWLDSHRTGFPDQTSARLEAQMRKLRLDRPPAREEPDLTWRGVAVLAQDGAGEPVIRMGNGFVKMIMKQMPRARFELARVAAQAWAPCELVAKGDTGNPWDPLLACLGVKDAEGCAIGSFSEAGWAVSTTVAAVVAPPPGCVIPAFAEERYAKCVRKIPLPLMVSSVDSAPEEPRGSGGWKEARR